jgi:pimeloyl-ACP methyl ester carboxylesterase
VILVDLQGHGRTADIDRPLRPELMADDVAALIKHLGVEQADLLVFGDADAIRPAHMVEFFALLGGGLKDAGFDGSGRSSGQLAVLPGASHYDILAHPHLEAILMPFLDS